MCPAKCLQGQELRMHLGEITLWTSLFYSYLRPPTCVSRVWGLFFFYVYLSCWYKSTTKSGKERWYILTDRLKWLETTDIFCLKPSSQVWREAAKPQQTPGETGLLFCYGSSTGSVQWSYWLQDLLFSPLLYAVLTPLLCPAGPAGFAYGTWAPFDGEWSTGSL